MTIASSLRRPFLRTILAASALAFAVHAEGNVAVRVDGGGNLIVEGDSEANQIQISPVTIGAGTVLGLGTTTVNGEPSAEFAGVTRDFRIRMKGGDDEVLIQDADGNHVPEDLEVELGGGDDHLFIRGFFIEDDLDVRAGPGDDLIEFSDTVFVLDRTEIRTSLGDDRVLFHPADVAEELLVFADSFEVHGGPGRDFVGITGALFQDEVLVDLGDGDDLGALGGPAGGVSVCGTVFEDEDVLAHVRFKGGAGTDGAVLEGVCGIAPPFVLQDFQRGFEVGPDDGSYLGGEVCARSCP